ncbi:unnamed protein product [Medioppia subpectinata]|uniref:Conserved oligomeric Golgi complex subunit 1 n=1 Tax=Medioppia subpectinata TaxID=1979941 RepID=A0A7R9L1V1_9ACAR|nr:unnamed protein product [Medioppia subpectinata]CAG2113979.1 unnamed protein product [Medioppia subpectinata]
MSETSQTNVDYLLEKFTITEIIDIQNKLKTDIDRKKQELKQLVGERYGDLIEAVDTIKQMNQSVDNVLNSLQSLASSQSNHMLSLKQSSFDKTNGFDEQHSRGSGDLVKRYKCGIWTSLEKEDLLRSTYDYFYGQHLCQLFEQLVPANETPSLLKQYKTAINRFNEVIVKKCWHFDQKSSLMDTLDESTNADIFCCLLVLQDLNPNHLFDTVLEKRKSALEVIDNQMITNQTKQWVSNMKTFVEPLLAKLFESIDSVNTICVVLNEINDYLKRSQKTDEWEVYCEELMGVYLPIWDHFIISHDLETIETHLVNACHSLIEDIKGLFESNNDTNNEIILFSAQFFRQITQSCPHLKQCFETSSPVKQYSWSKMKDILLSYSYKSYKAMFDLKLKQLFSNTTSHSLTDLNTFICNSFVWDIIKTTEVSDEGKTVTSKIEVPLQMSSFLHNNFTQLSNEVNRLTGHTVPRVVVIDTLSTLSQYLSQLYGSACDGLSEHEYPKSIKQVIALQLYFDLLYFKQLLATTRDESIKSKQVVKIYTSTQRVSNK